MENDLRVAVRAFVELLVGLRGLRERQLLRDDEARRGAAGDDQVAQLAVVPLDVPKTMPGSAAVRPSYMWRSEPQIAADVILTMTSFGCSIRGSSTCSTETLKGSPRADGSGGPAS
jgi:hypothetical protein